MGARDAARRISNPKNREMDEDSLEKMIGEALAGTNLSSTARDKFDLLLNALAARWRLPVDTIVAKALAAPKNHGNRISEGTRGSHERLVLLSDEPLELADVARVFEARSLRSIPTLVLARNERDSWSTVGVLLAPGESNPFGVNVPVTYVEMRSAPEFDDSALDAMRLRIEGLTGAGTGIDVAETLGSSKADDRLVVVKHVGDARNLGNRIGEALGRQPAFVVMVSPPEFTGAVRRTLADQLERFPGTSAYVVSHGPDGFVVEPAEPTNVPPPSHDDGQDVVVEFDDLGASIDKAEPSEDDQTLSYKQLPRVKLMLRHLPIDAGAEQLYEEHREADDILSYETSTLKYLRGLLRAPTRVFVVLTGDAGHGKTHLCRRLLEGDSSSREIVARLSEDPVATQEWPVSDASALVRVVKDLSEIAPPERAARRLVELLEQTDSHVVVCANEGRLRNVVAHESDTLRPLLDALESGLERGETHPPGREDVHVLNLNAQSATAEEGGFLAHVLDQFLNHQGAWNTCRSCRAHDLCPILAARTALMRSRPKENERANGRAATVELVRIAEETGHVLTYRETIALVALLVTGGLDCEDVEARHRDGRRHEELKRARLPERLFAREPLDAERRAAPILDRLRRMDPGLVASRAVDERLHARLEAAGGLGSELFDESVRRPSTRKEHLQERSLHRALIRRARREAWFVAPELDEHGVSRVSRLGLRHHALFRALQEAPSVSEMVDTLRVLVRGLHTVQGAVGVDSKSDLHLVDPAFGRSGSHASIIARTIPVRRLRLLSESAWWNETREVRAPVLDAVEWIDRRVVLVDEREPEGSVLALDLLGFEFVMSAADGIVMRGFHSAARRRILRTLARHAQRQDERPDSIRVLLGRRGEGRLIVERDDTIVLEGIS